MFLTSNTGEVKCLEICYACCYHFSMCSVKKKKSINEEHLEQVFQQSLFSLNILNTINAGSENYYNIFWKLKSNHNEILQSYNLNSIFPLTHRGFKDACAFKKKNSLCISVIGYKISTEFSHNYSASFTHLLLLLLF